MTPSPHHQQRHHLARRRPTSATCHCRGVHLLVASLGYAVVLLLEALAPPQRR
jgi:hypothetical protein